MNAATFDFVRYRATGGAKHAVRKRGRKYHSLVVIDHPISVCRVSIEDECFMVPVTYPLESAVARFLDAATRCGITEGARRILEEAKASLGANMTKTQGDTNA